MNENIKNMSPLLQKNAILSDDIGYKETTVLGLSLIHIYKGYNFPEPDLIETNPQSTWNLSYHPYCL